MGVQGAALATILSQAVSCVWVIAFLLRQEDHAAALQTENLLASSPKLILPCVALGLSPFIMQASESVISVCFNSSLLRYGGDVAVGAMTILTSVMQFAMLPMQGLAPGRAAHHPATTTARKTPTASRKTFRLLLDQLPDLLRRALGLRHALPQACSPACSPRTRRSSPSLRRPCASTAPRSSSSASRSPAR